MNGLRNGEAILGEIEVIRDILAHHLKLLAKQDALNKESSERKVKMHPGCENTSWKVVSRQ